MAIALIHLIFLKYRNPINSQGNRDYHANLNRFELPKSTCLSVFFSSSPFRQANSCNNTFLSYPSEVLVSKKTPLSCKKKD